MSYDTVDASVAEGAPIEGYEFVGTYRTYRYTNADRTLTFLGNDYLPLAIKREDAVTGDQSQDGIEMTIDMPQVCQLIQDYVFGVAPPDLQLTIYRCHFGLDLSIDPIIYWVGPVTGFNIEGDIAKVRVPSVLENVFSGNLPNFFFQQSCNHTLFDARCGIIRSLYTVNASVLSVDDQLITVDDDGFDDNFLVGGVVAIPSYNEQRLILSNVSNVIKVFFPFSNLAVGDTVELSVGCDHSLDTCRAKFSNSRRFGGFPYIPQDNPFQGTIK